MIIKSGFVSIIGRSNVGKSTLLNTILNNKISIVTSKSQTTRNCIQGIYNNKELQIIFIDTPGIHNARNEIGKFMNKISFLSIKKADIILFLVQSNKQINNNDYYIIKILKEKKIPIILVITKIDLVSKNELIIKIIEWKKIYKFHEIIPISIIKYKNMKILINLLKKYLKIGPRYYPVDIITDQSKEFFICEIIREKIFFLTKYEIPYSVAIFIDKIEVKNKILKIMASICVEHYSQKVIIIGKKGSLIKEIGKKARLELEQILKIKIFLELFVKIINKWYNNNSIIKRLIYYKENY